MHILPKGQYYDFKNKSYEAQNEWLLSAKEFKY